MRSGKSVAMGLMALVALAGLGPDLGYRNEFSCRVAEIQDEDEKKLALNKAAKKRARKASVRRLNDLLTKRRNVLFFNAETD
jgi:hypothetical protein